MPRDQISAVGNVSISSSRNKRERVPLESYSLRSITSGAIQHGVPTNDLRAAVPLLAMV